MIRLFNRTDKLEALFVVKDDGMRVVVFNQEGNTMLDVSRALYDECWKRGYFEDLAEVA